MSTVSQSCPYMSTSMVRSSIPPRKRRATSPLEEGSERILSENFSNNTTKNFNNERKSGPENNKQDVYKELITSAIIKHGCLLNLFKQKGNGDILEYFLEVYERAMGKLRHDLGSILGKVCLTCDVWTSPMTKEYLCLIVNYVDCDWKLQSKFLNLVPLPYPCDVSDLQSRLYGLLHMWGIEKKVLTITLDDKRSCDIVQSMLHDCLNPHDGALLCNGDSFHIPCAVPFMDLMVQECFKVINTPICKIRKGVQCVVGHEDKRLNFEDAAKSAGSGSLDPLWLDYPMRWNSTYLMLERAIKYRNAFAFVMIGDTYTGWHMTDEEWCTVEKICKLLKPLCDIANLFLGTEHPTSNLHFINIWKTGMCLLEAMEDEDLEICNMAQNMKTRFDEYWESCNAVLALQDSDH